MARKVLFREDEALKHDPDYSGIHGWWESQFGRNFNMVWKSARGTEKDFGDSVERRVIVTRGNHCEEYILEYSPLGYAVYQELHGRTMTKQETTKRLRQMRVELRALHETVTEFQWRIDQLRSNMDALLRALNAIQARQELLGPPELAPTDDDVPF